MSEKETLVIQITESGSTEKHKQTNKKTLSAHVCPPGIDLKTLERSPLQGGRLPICESDKKTPQHL